MGPYAGGDEVQNLFMDQLYHAGATQTDEPFTGDNYRYKRFWGLYPYTGNHPAVMTDRIKKKGWHWDLKASPFVFTGKDLKKAILDVIEKVSGVRLFEYRSYKLVR